MSMVSIEPLKVNGDALLAINNEMYTLEDERLEATAITNLERKNEDWTSHLQGIMCNMLIFRGGKGEGWIYTNV